MRHVFLPIVTEGGGYPDTVLEIAADLARTLEGRLTVICNDDRQGEHSQGQATEVSDRRGGCQTPSGGIISDGCRMVKTDNVFATACSLAGTAGGIILLASGSETEAATALVDCGLPVFFIPRSTEQLDLQGEALLLWDGSRGAVHALGAALPLLRNARVVRILEIDDGSLRRPASEALSLLKSHGIEANIQHDLAFGEKAGLVIMDQIATLKPAYVVMGGFGHARWLEGVIGGVTRRLLTECPVPVFLKH